MEDTRPTVLILSGKISNALPVEKVLGEIFNVEKFATTDEVMAAIRRKSYHAIFADAGDFIALERGLVTQQSNLLLNTIGEGVCIVNADGSCPWSNNKMRSFPADVFTKARQICVQARNLFAHQTSATSDGSMTRSKKYTFQACSDRYFEMITSPVMNDKNEIHQVCAVVWDATSGKRLQQRLNAVDTAGRELAKLDSEAIAKLAPGQRLQLLQEKIIRNSKDLLHFDHFAIRLVDERTNKLEIVIHEGLPAEALEVDLYVQPEGNGISGWVASTGRSYICHDTERDPRYVTGMHHCKSSLTVPLKLNEKVIGVFNIESERVGAFDEDDRQFAEIFGQYAALALNILNLLVVERCEVTGRVAENVVQEMAQPLNDIVTETQSLIEEYIGDDSMRERLNRIMDNIETIRKSLREVRSGPQRVLGAQEIETKHDPLIAGKRILIADDELNIREPIGLVLTRLGAICTVCKDGHEAHHAIESQDFDLVVSDIKMPHRNGYEIFATAKRRRENLPVILMTGFGYDPHHSIVRAHQEGLSSVLFKPFKVDELLEKIREALKKPDAAAPVKAAQ